MVGDLKNFVNCFIIKFLIFNPYDTSNKMIFAMDCNDERLSKAIVFNTEFENLYYFVEKYSLYFEFALLYLPADRPHFFLGKMGPKLGLRLIRGYKRFDTSLICTRTHGSTVNWRFNVRFKLFLTYNTYNYPVLDLNNFFFPMKTIESLGCGQYAGAVYLRVNTVFNVINKKPIVTEIVK